MRQAKQRIARNLNTLLCRAGWTQGDLARELWGSEVGQAERMRVSRWMRGEVAPGLDEMVELAAIFECSVDDLLK